MRDVADEVQLGAAGFATRPVHAVLRQIGSFVASFIGQVLAIATRGFFSCSRYLRAESRILKTSSVPIISMKPRSSGKL